VDVRTIDVAGRRLRLATTAPSPGTLPLLFFNGIGADVELVRVLAEELRAFGIGIIVFDVPGTGGSSSPAPLYRFPWLARLANDVLGALGIDGQVDVAGVSWGGALAQEFTRRFPLRVRRLVLAATSAGTFAFPGRLTALAKMLSIRRYLDRTYLAGIGASIYGGKVSRDKALLARFNGALRSPRGSGYYLQVLAGAGWTSALWLHTLAQPTLVMMGTDDPLVPVANGRVLAAFLPNARLVTIDDGHLLLLTSARECAPIIADFLGVSALPHQPAAAG